MVSRSQEDVSSRARARDGDGNNTNRSNTNNNNKSHANNTNANANTVENIRMKNEIEMLRLALEELQSKQDQQLHGQGQSHDDNHGQNQRKSNPNSNPAINPAINSASTSYAYTKRSPKRKTHSSGRKQLQRLNEHSNGSNSPPRQRNDRHDLNDRDSLCPDFSLYDENNDNNNNNEYGNYNNHQSAPKPIPIPIHHTAPVPVPVSSQKRVWRNEPESNNSSGNNNNNNNSNDNKQSTNQYNNNNPNNTNNTNTSNSINNSKDQLNNTIERRVYKKRLEIKDILESIVDTNNTNGIGNITSNTNDENNQIRTSYIKPININSELNSSRLDRTMESDSRLYNTDGTYYTVTTKNIIIDNNNNNNNSDTDNTTKSNLIKHLPLSQLEYKNSMNNIYNNDKSKSIESNENTDFDGFNIEKYLKKNMKKSELFEKYDENEVNVTLQGGHEKYEEFENVPLFKSNSDFLHKLKTVSSTSRPSTTISAAAKNIIK